MAMKMKDSGIEWIGEIPEDWEVKKLKYCCSIDSEKLPETTDADFSFDYIDIGSVDELGEIGEVDRLDFGNSPSRARMIVSENDVIVSTVRTYLRAIAHISQRNRYVCSTGFAVLKPQSKLDGKFLFYQMRSEFIVQNIVSRSVGVSYPAIAATALASIELLVPAFSVQTRIASFLDTRCAEIDAVIAAKQQQNELLKEQRQSVVFEAVTKGLHPTVTYKDSGVEWIGEIPEGWEVRRIKHLIAFPLQYGANETGEDFDETLPRYIRITDISSNNELKNDGMLSLSSDKASGYILQDGDVLFARSGATVGKTFYYKGEYGLACFAGYMIRLSADSSKISGRFIYYYTLSKAYAEWTKMIFIQATIQNISAEKYSDLQIPLPPLFQQDQIISFLDTRCAELDRVVSANNAVIDKLKEYRQSLIYEAVTGKIAV